MAKAFQPTPHPVLGLPTAEQAVAMGSVAWNEAMVRRERIIAEEKADPFQHLWQPPIWRVCDALLGVPWVDKLFAEAMRKHLGFEKPVRTLLILGGNRAGKTQYAANRTMRVLFHYMSAKAWALHSTLQMSRDYQQPIFYNYLPAGLKGVDVKSKTAYIAYKQKTGFSDEQFVLPPQKPGAPGSSCTFKAYEQDIRSIEGGNLEIVWPDELVPSDWVETLELRVAEKNGWVVITFTPVEGYTETVRLMCDGAEVVKESTAFLVPNDGGKPLPHLALGLSEEKFAELALAEQENRAALYPQSRPENCAAWLETPPHPSPFPQGGEGEDTACGDARPTNPVNAGQPAVPAGREFKRVPRVLKCADPEGKRAVVYFHSSDNPYGNPKRIWGTIASKSEDFILERFYGIATKTMSARFKKFNRSVHVIPPNQIPKDGTNYQRVDPAGRNFFMLWLRVTPRAVYVYREWPGNYAVPGVGVPGPWALPDGKHLDGKRGPAQKAFGWGLRRYKEEIARLEGWHDLKKLERKHETTKEEREKFLDEMSEHNGAREVVQDRQIDSRFGSTPRMENDRPVTLIEQFADLNLFFEATPGDDIEEGARLIDDALDYDETAPVDYFNAPRLYVSADCVNTIFSLMTWTGMTKEGRRNLDGASKDPIDCLRYFFLSECPYLGGVTETEEQASDFSPTKKNYY
jgi:phage terminase large subunit-like protein